MSSIEAWPHLGQVSVLVVIILITARSNRILRTQYRRVVAPNCVTGRNLATGPP